MAFVRRFERMNMRRNSLHDEIAARYAVFEHDGRVLVQINTYGRDERQDKEKLSQTLQLDREGADALRRILDEAFGS